MESTIREKVQHWLDGPYDEASKAEVKALLDAGEDKALTDAFYRTLEFGTGGLRGLMGAGTNRVNRYTIGAATQGLSNYLKASFPDEEIKVAIAHDSRHGSPDFARVTADVFSANGIRVYFFPELRPTPALSFAIRHLGCHSGVMVTASHNPKEYNGYKAYWQDGGQLVPPHDKRVIAEVEKVRVEDIRFDRRDDLVEMLGADMDDAYLAMIDGLVVNRDAIKAQPNLPIVFTPIHGTGGTLIPAALARAGFTHVHELAAQSTPDGDFPTVVYPNPEEHEALALALEKAREIGAELVMATDPDADRVGIAIRNPEGELELLNGNQTAGMLFYYLLSAWRQAGKLTGKEYIAKTIVTSEVLDQMAKNYGVACYNTLTGFKYIAEVIRAREGKETFICGGEESYGYLIGDAVRDKDAVAACVLIAEMAAYVKQQGQTLYDFMRQLYVENGLYRERLLSVTKKGKEGAEEIQRMMADLRANPPRAINGSPLTRMIDYQSGREKDMRSGEDLPTGLARSNVLQFYTEDGSKISARPSGTEPKIKFYLSVHTPLTDADQYETGVQQLEARMDAIVADLQF